MAQDPPYRPCLVTMVNVKVATTTRVVCATNSTPAALGGEDLVELGDGYPVGFFQLAVAPYYRVLCGVFPVLPFQPFDKLGLNCSAGFLDLVASPVLLRPLLGWPGVVVVSVVGVHLSRLDGVLSLPSRGRGVTDAVALPAAVEAAIAVGSVVDPDLQPPMLLAGGDQ